MKKLFDFKNWLTIPDSAQYLSLILSEAVSEAEILRLALDGHLQLSVNLVNGAEARKGLVVSYNDTQWVDIPGWLRGLEIPDEYRSGSSIMTSIPLGAQEYLNLNDSIEEIDGIWDLAMLGGEYISVEERYLQITGGPRQHGISIAGTLLEAEDGSLWQLQTPQKKLPQSGEYKAVKEIVDRKLGNEIRGDKLASFMMMAFRERLYNESNSPLNNGVKYSPSAVLPQDCILVVRTSALKDFEDKLKGRTSDEPKELTTTQKNSLLKIILGMAMAKYDYDPYTNKNKATGNNAGSIASDLNLKDLDVSADTIRSYLDEAKELLGRRP